MKVLVVGSCTGAKDDFGCPDGSLLSTADFADPIRLHRRENGLQEWVKPASKLYLGRQHTQMMEGVRILRSTYGAQFCDVAIVSAGYGLIEENRHIAPYNITFQGMLRTQIREQGRKLGIPSNLRNLISAYAVVFFLLGDDYLLSAEPPLIPTKDQKFIAFGSHKHRYIPNSSVVVVSAAQKEASEFSDGVVTLKGRMFKLFAIGLQQSPTRWTDFLQDKSKETLLDLMRQGNQR
jgi:hypothetical protein